MLRATTVPSIGEMMVVYFRLVSAGFQRALHGRHLGLRLRELRFGLLERRLGRLHFGLAWPSVDCVKSFESVETTPAVNRS